MKKVRTVDNFDNEYLRQESLEVFRKYLNEHYNEAFYFGRGTEHILKVLKETFNKGKWLDIGGGPTTLFWGLMSRQISELHCSEVCPEGLFVLDEFIQSNQTPKCYLDVMKLFKIEGKKLKELRSCNRKYLIFDALSKWPSQMHGQYETITAMGVFGLCENPDQYKECFGLMKIGLRENGVAIGANWVRSRHFIATNGVDNRYLDPILVIEAAKEYGYKILHLSEERIDGDPKYDKVIIWALSK